MTTARLKDLFLSPFNVRQTQPSSEEIDDFACSIAAHGLIEPLVVHDWPEHCGFGVLAGGRRLAALRRLFTDQEEGDTGVAFDFDNIPIIVREGTDDELREISLAENIERVDLRPHEEYAAFVAFAGNDDPQKIAARFGKPVRYVKQRLRLGRLHPTIFAALTDGSIDVEQAEAYAATDDVQVQIRVFEENERNRCHNIYSIRRTIKGESASYEVQQKLAFVGREAYAAAGGTLIEDLFTSELDAPIVNDIDILNAEFDRQYAERLPALCAMLTEKYGATFEAVTDYRLTGSTVHPIKAEPSDEQIALLEPLQLRKGEIEQALYAECEEDVLEEGEADKLRDELGDIESAIRAIDNAIPVRLPEGVERVLFVPSIRDGMVTAPQFFHPADLTEKEMQEIDEPVPHVPAVTSTPPAAKPEITKRAIEELSAARRQVLVNFLDDNDPQIHGLATLLLLFSLARGRYGHRTPAGFRHIGMGDGPLPAFVTQAWFQQDVEEVAFAMFAAGDPAEIESVAQQLVGRMIEPKLETPPGILSGMGQAYLPDTLIRERGYWTPSAAFFDLFNKGQLAGFVEPIDPDQASTMRRMKTGDAKARALAFFTGELTGMTADVKAKALAWVPEWLVFHVEQSPGQDTGPAEPAAEVQPIGRINEDAAGEPVDAPRRRRRRTRAQQRAANDDAATQQAAE